MWLSCSSSARVIQRQDNERPTSRFSLQAAVNPPEEHSCQDRTWEEACISVKDMPGVDSHLPPSVCSRRLQQPPGARVGVETVLVHVRLF